MTVSRGEVSYSVSADPRKTAETLPNDKRWVDAWSPRHKAWLTVSRQGVNWRCPGGMIHRDLDLPVWKDQKGPPKDQLQDLEAKPSAETG